ncbi:MAG TPA: ABC transporter permease [Pyrinomonadaceae bacterium]|nr:ABC transporter permease [Pyrinomonadaceae bacterium]
MNDIHDKTERGDSQPIELIAGTSLWRDAWRRLLKNKLAVFGMIVVIGLTLASVIGPTVIQRATGYAYDVIPKETRLNKSFPPFRSPEGTFSWTHPMGTDNAGRDILARVLSGGQISLMVALISTLVSLVIGVSYGAIAGYVGGGIDDLMMRVVDVLYSLPYVIIVIVLLALLPAEAWVTWLRLLFKYLRLGVPPLEASTVQLAELFFALGAVSWLTMARIVRGQVMSLKNQDFVLAARATGVSAPKIIFRHLVPNALGPVIVYATLTVPTVMLSEAFLSFLGLGVRPPRVSWGSLAADGAQTLAIFPWQLICPGVTMALMLLSLNFLGDGLRDALDPQARRE